ncbi:hypothetical protein AB0J90_26620 [Micromonospora sp. NPDC049523]
MKTYEGLRVRDSVEGFATDAVGVERFGIVRLNQLAVTTGFAPR